MNNLQEQIEHIQILDLIFYPNLKFFALMYCNVFDINDFCCVIYRIFPHIILVYFKTIMAKAQVCYTISFVEYRYRIRI